MYKALDTKPVNICGSTPTLAFPGVVFGNLFDRLYAHLQLHEANGIKKWGKCMADSSLQLF